MSNKTQLQTNNTKVDSLIELLRTKSAGGSGGGSVETCTVTVINDVGAGKMAYSMVNNSGKIEYIVSDVESRMTLVCPRGSFITISWGSSVMPILTNAERVEMQTALVTVCKLNEDATTAVISTEMP